MAMFWAPSRKEGGRPAPDGPLGRERPLMSSRLQAVNGKEGSALALAEELRSEREALTCA